MKIRVSYKFIQQKNKDYASEYVFQVVPRASKELWMVYENSSHVYDKEKTLYTQEIPPVAHNDIARISLDLYSMAGCVDFNSIEFHPLIIENFDNKNHKTECFIEKQVRGYWSSSNVAKKIGMIRSSSNVTDNTEANTSKHNCFGPSLELVSQHFHGVETRITKYRYRAKKIGK